MKQDNITKQKASILIVEDEILTAQNIKKALLDLGFEVAGLAANATNAIQLVKQTSPDLILMDIMLKGTINGIETAERIKEFSDIPIIFLTAYSDPDTIKNAIETTPYGYIVKPFENRDLQTNIEMTLYRSAMEKKVRDSEENLRITLNSIGDGVIATDDKGFITRMNPVAENMCGWKLSDAAGKKLEEVFVIKSAITGKKIDTPVNEVLTTGKNVQLANHTILVSRDGTERHIADCASPIRNDRGIIQGVVLVFSDVTESYKAREALQKSEFKFRTMVDQAAEMLFLHDLEGNIIDVNHAAVETTGYSREELLSMKVFDIDPDADNRMDKKNIWEDTPFGKKKFFEVRHKRKDGLIYDAEIRAGKIMLEEGEFILALANNISERKKAESELRQSENKLKSIFRAAPVGIGIVIDRKFIEVNDTFCKMIQYSREELLEQNTLMIYPSKEEFDYVGKEKYRQIAQKGIGTVETRFICKNGEVINIILCSVPVDFNDLSKGTIFTALDITERKKGETELQKWAEIFKASYTGIVLGDAEGKNLMQMNPSFARMHGYTVDELIGKPIKTVFAPSEYENIPLMIKEAHDTGHCIWESLHIKKDGTIFPVLIILTAVKNDEGKVLYRVVNVIDISEKKRVEEELQLLHRAVEQSQVSVIITNKDAKIEYVNPKFIEVTGYSFEEVIGQNPRILKSDKFSTEDYIEMWKGLSAGNQWSGVFLNKKKNGELFWESASISPIRNNKGEITHYVGVKEDITEKVKAEEELKKYRNHLEDLVEERTQMLDLQNIFLRTFIDTIPVPVFVKDKNGCYTDINPAFEKYFKTKRDDIIGKKSEALFSADTVKTIERNDKQLYDKYKNIVYEYDYELIDGTVIPFIVYKSSFGLSESKPDGIAGIIIDITERKKLEEQIVTAYEKEKELNELKTNFISMASHEFRTPLTAILNSSGLIELYAAKSDNENIIKNVRRIEYAIDTMTELLDDVLLISRGEKGKLQFNPAKFNLKMFCNNLVEETSMIATSQHSIEFDYRVKEEIVKADEKLLRLMLINFLSNAVKYSPDGGKIIFEVEEEKKQIKFRVKDEGIGISEKDLEKAFEPFHRAANVSQIKGTGLGLNIAKLAAELHGGYVNIESQLSKGTTITAVVKIK